MKPVLAEYKYWLNMSDEVVGVGNRVYVKATCSVISEKGVIAVATGFAREAETKKGMDDSQITGAASSYARKYALNGLFAIDDTKDADTNEHKNQVDSAKPVVNKLIVKQLNDAQSMQELIDLWETVQDKPMYVAIKDHAKAKLLESMP